eukprot:scaffold326533_cov57-Tisochrysis_lutea.AAC.1
MASPGTWRIAIASLATRSRRNAAARIMCLVFLNATGSRDMLTADLESEHNRVGPDGRRLRSTR